MELKIAAFLPIVLPGTAQSKLPQAKRIDLRDLGSKVRRMSPFPGTDTVTSCSPGVLQARSNYTYRMATAFKIIDGIFFQYYVIATSQILTKLIQREIRGKKFEQTH